MQETAFELLEQCRVQSLADAKDALVARCERILSSQLRGAIEEGFANELRDLTNAVREARKAEEEEE